MSKQETKKFELTRRAMLTLTAGGAAMSWLAGTPMAVPSLLAADKPEGSSLPSMLKSGLPGIETNQFWQALQQHPGSSFQLGDKRPAFNANLDLDVDGMEKGWDELQLVRDETKPVGPGVTTRRMVYEDGHGLRMTREFTFYGKFQAAEYKTSFENIGSSDLPAISKVFPLDLWFPFSAFERLIVHSTGTGAQWNTAFPMDMWTLNHTELLKAAGQGYPTNVWPMGGTKEMADRGAQRPIALVEDRQSGHGMFLALGWSGYWKIMFKWVDYKKTPFPIEQTFGGKVTNTLQIYGGMPDGRFVLRPGEKIPSPTVLLGFYQGGVTNGSNQLRRVKEKHYCLPWPAGVPESPVYFDYFYASAAKLTESDFKKLADRAAELGVEYFFIGMDWVPERMWAQFQPYVSQGEPWNYPVDGEIFPSRSLRPFSDYLHSKGLKFGLWLEAGHVEGHWPVAQEHPDWFWPKPSGPPSSTHYVNYYLNLTKPDALEWVKKQMARAIRAWNVDLIFNDRMFGITETQWAPSDPPGQSGITQVRYLEAKYALWDFLHAEFPHLLLLNPGAPDIELMRRTHVTMAGHMVGDGNMCRYELTGLNWFYTTSHMIEDFIEYKDSYEEPYPLSTWLSRFAAMLGLGDPIGIWSPATFAQGKRVIEVYKSIRHLLSGDFYSLFEAQPRSLETWDGWQFHNPDHGEGFTVAFRLRYCEQPSATIRLQGLKESATYRFEDPFTGQHFTLKGDELVKRGHTVSLPKNGAQLLHYTVTA